MAKKEIGDGSPDGWALIAIDAAPFLMAWRPKLDAGKAGKMVTMFSKEGDTSRNAPGSSMDDERILQGRKNVLGLPAIFFSTPVAHPQPLH